MQALKDLLTKYRKQLLAPITVGLAALLLVQIYFILVITPQPNDECIWYPSLIEGDEIGFIFHEVKFEGVTWNAGIRDGDRLLEINGKKIEDARIANEQLYSMESGDSANYRISRESRVFDAKVEVKKLIQIGGLAYFLFSAIWLIVGVIVINGKPDGYTQALFFRIASAFVLFSCFNLLYSQNVFNPIFDYPVIVIIVDTLHLLGGIFLPFLLIHFFWVFPRRMKIVDRKFTLKILYSLPFLLFIIIVGFKIFYVYDNSAALNFFLGRQNFVLNSFLFIGACIGFISLFINYTRLGTKNERNAIFIILIAYGIGLAVGVYTSVLFRTISASSIYNSPELFTPIILIVLLPIAFGFSIFKYSLMDVTEVLKNTFLYGAATVSIAAIYFFIIYVLGQTVSSAIGTEYQGIIAGIVFIVFAIIFQSTKTKFEELITRKFYPEQFAYQKVIHKFSSDVATIVGLENILKSTSRTFIESLQVEKFAIFIKDSSKANIYKPMESIGFKDESFPLEVNIGNLAQFILTKNDSNLLLVIEETDFRSIFPNHAHKLVDEEIFTILPLLMKSKVIGFLLFGLKHSGSKFAGKDLELLSVAANQTAVAIENARLYEAEAEKLKMDRDLENARLIQSSLLPRTYPEIKGLDFCGRMIPAMHVGGDYYDLIKVSDTKMFIIIGDVSGKGLSASFYMSKLQTMIQLYCNDQTTPKEVLMEINKRIYGSIEKNWFITVSVALVDSEKKNIRFARAGHTPLAIIDKEKTKEFTPRGIGVGLEKGEIFDQVIEEINIDLTPQSLTVFYSDGVTELMDNNNNLFGFSRFSSILSDNLENNCEKIMDDILSGLLAHRNGAPQNDDITLVLLKYNG